MGRLLPGQIPGPAHLDLVCDAPHDAPYRCASAKKLARLPVLVDFQGVGADGRGAVGLDLRLHLGVLG